MCDESRTHGVEWGKIRRLLQRITYHYGTFARAIHQFPDIYKKILYGTDFCPPLNLSAIGEYDATIARLFPPEQHASIYYENCLRAFPRLADWLKGE